MWKSSAASAQAIQSITVITQSFGCPGVVMGKAKKSKFNRTPSKPYSRPVQSNKKAPTSCKPAQPPTVPFEPDHRILLVGEGSAQFPRNLSMALIMQQGDFSFSHSLLAEHGCCHLIATSYDSRSALSEKYSQAARNVKELEAEEDIRVLYGIDATKLEKAGKQIRKGSFDRIVFNFPHVGGLTKDVNRQVRHNQELLVGFFKSALPLLASDGSIVVTIFEGEPYTLWNVRDLARHVGLKVQRSFKFEACAYPGYKHARTLGNIRDDGGWKGEDRASRTYIFEAKDQDSGSAPNKPQKGDSGDEDE